MPSWAVDGFSYSSFRKVPIQEGAGAGPRADGCWRGRGVGRPGGTRALEITQTPHVSEGSRRGIIFKSQSRSREIVPVVPEPFAGRVRCSGVHHQPDRTPPRGAGCCGAGRRCSYSHTLYAIKNGFVQPGSVLSHITHRLRIHNILF